MKTDSEKNFGARVEQLLEERQIKVMDFIQSTGISNQALYDWKRRQQAPNARTALKVAQFFGVTVEYLLTGETSNPLQATVDELQAQLKQIREFVLEHTSA